MEKPNNNFSPNPEERIITPDVVEEGLQRMREEEAKKVTDVFDALRSCRDFLDKRFFKRERRRTKEAYPDNPAREREGIRSIHHERYLQSGAKLFHITEEVARSNIFITGDELYKTVKERFKKDKLPMSKDQDIMLSYAGEIWDEDKKEVRNYIQNIYTHLKGLPGFLLGSSTPPEEISMLKQDALVLDKIKDYQNEADLRQINDLINSNHHLKSRVIHDLGYRIQTAGKNFNASTEEIKQNLDSITIDLLSYYPIILVTVKDEQLWNQSGHKDCRGFYYPEGEFKSLGMYHLETADKDEKSKNLEHEFQHAVRYRFFTKVKNRAISRKAALSKEPLEDLERIENLLGGMYEMPESGKTTVEQGKDSFKVIIKQTQETIEKRIDETANKDRDFWHVVQNEFCSYLERSKGKNWFGRLRPLITEEMHRDINERNLVSKEALADFDILHDMVAFYLNAGFGYEEISDIIRTSKDFKTAQKRIEEYFRLDEYRVKKVIAPENELEYRNMIKVLNLIEKHNQVEYFFETLNLKKAAALVWSLSIGSHKEDFFITEITEDSMLGNEKIGYDALEKIVTMCSENHIIQKQLQKSPAMANDTVKTLQFIELYAFIFKFRSVLLERLDKYPEVIRKTILHRLSKRINKDLLDKEAIAAVEHGLNNELPSLEELRNIGDLKESWVFEDPAYESSCEILDKWLNLPGEKRRSFIDRIKEVYAKNPEGVFILYHLERLVGSKNQ